MNSGQIIKKYEVVFYNNPYAEIDNWEKFINKTWETSENYDVDVDINGHINETGNQLCKNFNICYWVD